MFCVNCGKSYEDAYKFCNHCGALVPRVVRPQESVIAPEPIPVHEVLAEARGPVEPPALIEEPVLAAPLPLTVPEAVVEEPAAPLLVEELPDPLPRSEPAPYVACVSFTLGIILLLSVLAFDIGQGAVRNRWDSWLFDIPAVIGAALLIPQVLRAWRAVFLLDRDVVTVPKRRHQRVVRNSIIIALLFFAVAAGAGATIGKSREEALQFEADSEHMRTVGDRVSKARAAVEATIPSYVAMYTKIAPDIDDLEATFRRMQEDLDVYDKKFPAQHETTAKSIADVALGLKRMVLVKKQIALMKQIQLLPTEDDQLATWRSSMLPIMREEDDLK